jgi:5-methylcytosine-specific restriction endonuclease McrA
MQYVFVVDIDGQPLDPCHPARARKLLRIQRAVVQRRYPFTIRIVDRTRSESTVHEYRLKIDPGSQITGLALLQGTRVVWASEIVHRGQHIKHQLDARRVVRHSRRQRKTRYRAPCFLNRRRPAGWLPPSLASRVANVETWVARLARWCPLTALSMELVRFDMQQLMSPDIEGVAYQHGELCGYEVREYLLEKFQRTCAYCGAHQVPLEVEHITPKARGGSNRVSNLTLACVPCNQKKGSQTAAEFGHPEVQALAKQPLKDAAAVNATRWALFHRLQQTGLPVECGSGGRTKYNRTMRGLSKTHWHDAACVGASTPATVRLRGITPLQIRAMGHGTRQCCRTNAHGFPIVHRARQKRFFGIQTGDIVRAVVPKGKYAGTWVSRVVAKASGYFDLIICGKKASISHTYCTVVWRTDGYDYNAAC